MLELENRLLREDNLTLKKMIYLIRSVGPLNKVTSYDELKTWCAFQGIPVPDCVAAGEQILKIKDEYD